MAQRHTNTSRKPNYSIWSWRDGPIADEFSLASLCWSLPLNYCYVVLYPYLLLLSSRNGSYWFCCSYYKFCVRINYKSIGSSDKHTWKLRVGLTQIGLLFHPLQFFTEYRFQRWGRRGRCTQRKATAAKRSRINRIAAIGAVVVAASWKPTLRLGMPQKKRSWRWSPNLMALALLGPEYPKKADL